MSLKNMNSALLSPKKDYTSNRLKSGALQLSERTHLVLDETAMEPGQLDATGKLTVEHKPFMVQGHCYLSMLNGWKKGSRARNVLLCSSPFWGAMTFFISLWDRWERSIPVAAKLTHTLLFVSFRTGPRNWRLTPTFVSMVEKQMAANIKRLKGKIVVRNLFIKSIPVSWLHHRCAEFDSF